MGRMHYQEWNFIKFARWLALAAERACSKKNQGEKKKEEREKVRPASITAAYRWY